MPEFHSFRVEAVILRHSDYGEADRMLTLYTAQLGKTRALVKGARKITSRKAGHLEPFTHVKLQLAKGRDLPLVTQADTIDTYLALRENLLLTSQASYVIELLDRFTYEDGSENSAIFRLLTDTLARLASGADPWIAIRYYEMRLLDYLGFRPQLFECGNCRTRDPAGRPVFFVRSRRRDLPDVRTRGAAPETDQRGHTQVSAPLPALKIRGCRTCSAQPRRPGRGGESYAGLFHIPTRARTQYPRFS